MHLIKAIDIFGKTSLGHITTDVKEIPSNDIFGSARELEKSFGHVVIETHL